MTFQEARRSLQLLAEEEIGAPTKAKAYRARAEEDAKFGAAAAKSR